MIMQKVPRQFNPNAFWYLIARNYDYNTSSSKCTHIRNPCIRVPQRIMALGFFVRDDIVNVPRLFEMYFLLCILEGEHIDPGSFLAIIVQRRR